MSNDELDPNPEWENDWAIMLEIAIRQLKTPELDQESLLRACAIVGVNCEYRTTERLLEKAYNKIEALRHNKECSINLLASCTKVDLYEKVLGWMLERISVDDFGDVSCDDSLIAPQDIDTHLRDSPSFLNILEDIRSTEGEDA